MKRNGGAEVKAGTEKGKKESLYDKIPFTVKQLDIFIAVMIALFVVFFALGVLKGS